MSPYVSLVSSGLIPNPPSSPHVPSPLSPNYQPSSTLRSSVKPVGDPNRRSTLFQLSQKFLPLFSARSPRSPPLHQYSPPPVKSPGFTTSFVTPPLSYTPVENEKATLDEDCDDVCLDVNFTNAELNTRKSLWVKAYRRVLV